MRVLARPGRHVADPARLDLAIAALNHKRANALDLLRVLNCIAFAAGFDLDVERGHQPKPRDTL